MAAPFPLQQTYTGMNQDMPRDELPSGALWNCVDWIPLYLGSPLRKRGGWSYASLALGASTYADAVAYAPFAAGAKNIAVGQDGNAYSFTSGVSTSLGAAFAVAQNPVYHRNASTGLVVIPAASGSTSPKSYDGVTYGALGGTPPQGIYATVWKDRTLLANGTVGGTLFPNRIWFGPVGNAAGAWDTTNSWVDASFPITGSVALKSVILLFHQRTTERLRGTTPPTASTIGDLSQDAAFDVGCIDARSIVTYQDTVFWADARGVYQSDGAVVKDVTNTGGMRSYWQTVLSAFAAGYTVSAGIYRDTYIVSVMNGTTFIDCLAYDIQRNFWYRFANFPARAFARVGSTFEETYMALGNSGRIASLSSVMAPTAAVKADANGASVMPYFETALFRGYQRLHRRWIPSLAQQSWKNLYFNYDLRDAAADAPTIQVSYVIDPGSSSYTALTRTLGATTKYTRARRDMGFSGNGLALKVAQVGASSDTRFHGFEAEYSAREGSRLAQ